jgi:hypothetical protein
VSRAPAPPAASFRLLSRDPGQAPGYVLLDGAGTVLRASPVWVADWCAGPGLLDVAATEGQWLFPDSPADPNGLFKLAFDAGWSLRGIVARRYMRIPPKVWRGDTNANKIQVQNRIARGLSPAERALFRDIPAGRHGDVLDAIGIGRGALGVLHTDTYDWPGKGYGK